MSSTQELPVLRYAVWLVPLTVEGTRHTAYLGAGISCVDSIGNDYLINLNLPPEGTTCP